MPTPAKKAAVPALSDLIKKNDVGDQNQSPEENKENDHNPHDHNTPEVEEEHEDDRDANSDPYLSPTVVATVPNKTPAELAAETPDETAARYGVDTSITDEDADNPRVQAYRDTHVDQVPSGTHLHPDVAKDLQNRGISERGTDNAQVKRMVTDTYDFSPDAEHNDKF